MNKDVGELGLTDLSSLPAGGEFVWEIFMELNSARQSGFVPNPLPFAEFRHWEELNGVLLLPWEISALKSLDAVFLEICQGRLSQKPQQKVIANA